MSEIRIRRMVLSICQTNCYFLYREGQKGENGLTETIVIDPGDQGARIYEALSQKGFHVNAILLTHGHFDHIWGANELRRLSGAKIYAYEGEKELCEDAGKNVSREAGRPEGWAPGRHCSRMLAIARRSRTLWSAARPRRKRRRHCLT